MDSLAARARALAILARLTGLPVERLAPDLDLVADLGLDSAKALELLVSLEEELGIEVDYDDAATLATVGDVLGYLARSG